MKTIQGLQQGSPAWLAHRRTVHSASDAPAMMGASPYVSRAELIRQRATGIDREIDSATQRVFDKGHEVEPGLRDLAQAILGEELYPVTGISDDGYLGASFDGVTMLEDVIFEAKQPNAEKIACVKRGAIPQADYWQIVHQFAVCDTAQGCLYMIGDGTESGSHRLEITRGQIEDDIPKLLAGWRQFEADVAAYVPEPEELPAPAGKSPDQLPALRIEVTGMVTASNLAEFKTHAMTVLGSINRDLQTDEQFADAEKTVKWCSDVESRIAAAKQHALSQTASIEELFRTLDDVSAETRRIRLELDKLVKAEKDSRKAEIVERGRLAVTAHYQTINSTLGQHAIQPPQSLQLSLGASIKGLRTLTSITDAVDTAVANAKIEASQRADAVRANIAFFDKVPENLQSIFPDKVQLCATKSLDDLDNLVAARISAHTVAENKRLEDERERIRAEEVAKLQAEQDAKAEQEVREAAAATVAPVAPTVASPAPIPTPARRTPVRESSRPTDAAIIHLIATTYAVDSSVAIGWLRTMDLDALKSAA